MDIVKSISVLPGGGKAGLENPLALDMAGFQCVMGISSAYPKKLTSASLKWIFHYWDYICSLAFCKMNRNKEKRVITYDTSKWRQKINLSICGGFFPPLLRLYIIYWFCRFSHNCTGQTSTSLSWRQVWEGVENKDLKYITADLAVQLMPLGWRAGFGTVAWVGDRVAGLCPPLRSDNQAWG